MSTTSRQTTSPDFRLAIYRVVLSAGFLLFLSGVLAIPSYYETTTLWYKTGVDKIMLIGGQYLGLLGFILLYLQIIISARNHFLDQVFGSAQLLRLHQLNGLLLFLLAAGHILLVLIPEGLANLPMGKKFWPEMVGAALFACIILLAGSSHFRQRIHLPYNIWRSFHRPAGYLALLLATVHVLFVSESFEQTIPRIFVLSLFTLTIFWTVSVKASARRKMRTSSK
ncbi:MAG: ferric reductase-like transmembrane domain-containing protein [Desulfocapsaceae bacterium]